MNLIELTEARIASVVEDAPAYIYILISWYILYLHVQVVLELQPLSRGMSRRISAYTGTELTFNRFTHLVRVMLRFRAEIGAHIPGWPAAAFPYHP